MSRPLHIQYTGALYHVMARGKGRQGNFHEDGQKLGRHDSRIRNKNRKQGLTPAKLVFGYDLASDGVTLVGNSSELEAVAAMRELRARGWSFRKIAIEVGSRGFVTKQGSSTWSHTTIQSILSRAA